MGSLSAALLRGRLEMHSEMRCSPAAFYHPPAMHSFYLVSGAHSPVPRKPAFQPQGGQSSQLVKGGGR